MIRILALVVLALIRARRGDPGVQPLLDEAWSLGEQTGELPRIGPVAVARAEAAWLLGRPDEIVEVTDAALHLAVSRESTWRVGELLSWRRRAGVRDEVAVEPRGPFAAQIAGDWCEAARQWTQIGCPYEAALALADSDEEEPLRQALAELQRLGARSGGGDCLEAPARARRPRHPPWPETVDSHECRRVDRARDRDPRAGRRGAAQRGDRARGCSCRRARSTTTCRRSCASSRSRAAARPSPRQAGSGCSKIRSPPSQSRRFHRYIGAAALVASQAFPSERRRLLETYVILRRGGWRTPDELQAAAARSTEEGEQDARRRPLDPQLRARGDERRARHRLHLPGLQPGGDPQARLPRRPAGRRDRRRRGHRRRSPRPPAE